MSMPSTGLLPFLQWKRHRRAVKRDVVSMPSTGLLPFLLHDYGSYRYICKVSMPSTGLLPFLLIIECQIGIPDRVCQCPLRAYFHFYIMTKYNENGTLMCQCPLRAYFHFYGSLSEPLILLASESYFYK